jgi:hypothetical protein
MSTWKGYTILPMPSGGVVRSHRLARRYAIVGPTTGLRTLDAHDDVATESRSLEWLCTTPGEIKTALDFVDAVRGSLTPFWITTYERDLELASNLGAADGSMTIRFCGYTAYLFPMGAARRSILGRVLSSGAEASVKVTASVDNADGTETLTLEAPSGLALTVGDSTFGIMRLVRLEDDRLNLSHLSYGIARALMRVVEVPKEAP